MSRKLYVSQIEDLYAQKNFQVIGDIIKTNPFLKGQWKFMEFTQLATGTGIKIPHNLNFTPLDVILLSTIGGTVTFNYTSFDSTYIYINPTVTTSPMTIRLFIGRYSEESVNV